MFKTLLKLLTFGTILVHSLFSVSAQTLKPLTLDDVIPGGKTWRANHPKSPDILGLLPDGAILMGQSGLQLVNTKGETKLLLSTEEWSMLRQTSDQNLPLFTPSEANGYLQYYSDGVLYLLNYKTKEIIKFGYDNSKWTETHISPSGDYLILLDGKNIGLLESGGTQPTLLTNDGSLDIVYGTAAHRNEFGTNKGIFFSPSGRYFAFFRIDQSEVPSYPIVHMTRPNATVKPEKYPMAGGPSQKVTIGIYDTESKLISYLKTGDPVVRYLTNLAWSPDEESIYIEEVLRSQDECKLVEYSVSSGSPERTLITEKAERYVEPMQPIVFNKSNQKEFVRISRADGFYNLYLHKSNGNQVRQLTHLKKGEITSFLGIDPSGKYAYYTANGETVTGHYLYRVKLSSGKNELLTPEIGYHNVTLSSDFSVAYDSYSSKNTPGIFSLISLEKGNRRYLLEKSEVPDDFSNRPKVELGTLLSADGETPLAYKMTLPRDLDKSKHYPVIVYVYGGPHAQLVTESWNSLYYNWDQFMAEQGYIVFTLDNRGSANRGYAFESIIHRHLGNAEMSDQLIGIDYLKSLPFVDPDRIGVHGWSFGGFMTTNLMLSHPDIFKVGVAGGPVIDWKLYEVMYGERYMDTPEENPDGYKEANLNLKAKNLQGRLLLIHGAIDPVVVWQNSQEFLNATIQARTLPDYFVYPNHQHNVIGPDRVHLMMTVTRYFEDHLKTLTSKTAK